MRILHVIPQFPYFDQKTIIGGHASPLLTLARKQAARGDHVTILSYIDGTAGELKIASGLTAVSLFPSAKTSTVLFGLRFLMSSTAWARRHRDAFDVVHVHSGFADYLLVSKRMERVLGCPTIHSLYCPIPDGDRRVIQSLRKRVLRRCAGKITRLTAISRHTATSMIQFGIDREIAIVPPAIDLKRFYPVEDMSLARRNLGLDENEFVVLFVGNAKPQKNLSCVLRAFRILRDDNANVRLVITTELAAASTDRRLTQLREEMLELGIEDAITQFGIIDNMPELIRACDVLVAPFLDSFGPSDYFMAAMEAQASGKPTIVSAVGGMPEVVNDEVGRLIDPRDQVALGQAMIELSRSRSLRERLGTQARKNCEAYFSADTIADRFTNLYLEVS